MAPSFFEEPSSRIGEFRLCSLGWECLGLESCLLRVPAGGGGAGSEGGL